MNKKHKKDPFTSFLKTIREIKKDFFIGAGTDFWGNSLYSNDFTRNLLDDREFLVPIFVKLLPTLFTFSGSILAIFIFTKNPKMIKDLFKDNSSLAGSFIYF